MALIPDTAWSTRSINIDNNLYAFASTGPSWSTFMQSYGIRDQGAYEWDIRFTDHGQQKFKTAADDDAWLFIDGVVVGKMGPFNSFNYILTPKIYEKDSEHRIAVIRNNTLGGTSGVAAQWVGNEYDAVNIVSFSATPNPLTSGSTGIPESEIQLLWSVENASKIEIDQNVGDVTGKFSINVDTGLKSDGNKPSRSPAKKLYTLTAIGDSPSDIRTKNLNVFVYNDNVPNNFEIPNFAGLEQNQQYTHNIGPISGIDMITVARGSVNTQLEKNGDGAFSRTIFIENNDVLSVKFFTAPFSTDPRGLPNTRELYVDIGPVRKYFTVETRAPREDEQLNFGDNKFGVPFPTPSGNDEGSTEYLVSPTTLSIDQVELTNPYGVEIKTTLNDTAEVRVRKLGEGSWGNWQNTNPMFQDTGDLPSTTPVQIDEMDWTPITQRGGATVSDDTPNEISTRSSGNLISRNIQET